MVENPTFPGAIDALRAAGAHLAAIPVDHEGGRTDALQAVLDRHRPRAAYFCTMFHSPTGALMSEPRRRELARLATDHDLPVIDGTALGELSLSGSVGPPAAAFARGATFLTLASVCFLTLPCMVTPKTPAMHVVRVVSRKGTSRPTRQDHC